MTRRDSIMHKPHDARSALRRLVSFLGPFRWLIALVAVLCVTSNLLSLWGPNLAGQAINAAAAGKGMVDFDLVTYYAVRMLFCYVSSSLLTIGIHVLMTNVSKRVARQLRGAVFNKLMRLPVGFFDRNQAGDIISRVSYDVDVIATCMATDVTSILTSTVTVIGSVVMMVSISLPLSAVVLFSVPTAVLYTSRMRKITQPRFVKRSKNYGIMNGFVEEMLSGQKTIQAYAYEDEAERRFDRINTDAAEAYYDADRYGVTIGPTMGAINNITLSLIALLGSVLYMHGWIGLGNISSFVLYSRKFSGPINEIANIINELFSALAASERVFALLDAPEELQDRENAESLTDVRGDVRMDHVAFGYDENRTIIHDLSLHAEAGKLVAIVGPTGAGKTTIINLLMRFYDVDRGEVLIDERDIRDCTRKSGGRGKSCPHPSLHHAPARGLPDGHQRGRRQYLQRPEAAVDHRPGHALRRADADPGRGHLQRGYVHRARDPGRYARADAGQDLLRDRPPPVHHPARGPDPGAGPGRRGGAGYPRDPDEGEGLLLEAVSLTVRITITNTKTPSSVSWVF